MKGHWARYSPGTGFQHRYRHCLICHRVERNNEERPLIHKGRKYKK